MRTQRLTAADANWEARLPIDTLYLHIAKASLAGGEAHCEWEAGVARKRLYTVLTTTPHYVLSMTSTCMPACCICTCGKRAWPGASSGCSLTKCWVKLGRLSSVRLRLCRAGITFSACAGSIARSCHVACSARLTHVYACVCVCVLYRFGRVPISAPLCLSALWRDWHDAVAAAAARPVPVHCNYGARGCYGNAAAELVLLCPGMRPCTVCRRCVRSLWRSHGTKLCEGSCFARAGVFGCGVDGRAALAWVSCCISSRFPV